MLAQLMTIELKSRMEIFVRDIIIWYCTRPTIHPHNAMLETCAKEGDAASK